MSALRWPLGWFMLEAETHIEFGLSRWNGCDPKVCGLIAIKWLTKALKA